MREEEILDFATKIGIQAKFDGITKAQFEGILASLELIKDPKASLLATAAFTHRQAVRLGGHATAKLINEAMNRLYNSGCSRENARKLLGFAKWIFEIVEKVKKEQLPRINVKTLTFRQFLEILRRI